MCCQAGAILHILWNAKHFPMFVENNYLIWLEYTDFHIFINPFTAIIEYWQMCVRYIADKSAPSPHHDEVTTDSILLNMKNDMFLLVSNIILSKMLTLLYPVQPESLAVIYLNMYVVIRCYIGKWIDVPKLYKFTCCSVGRHTCKTIRFHSECL